jgi:membrane-associated protease RseP (regulator of RpoE activity)
MEEEKEHKTVEFTYGLVMLRTKRFRNLMDKLGGYRISKPVGWFLLYLMPVAAAIGLFVFLTNVAVFFSPQIHNIGTAVRSISPLGYLGLPGINPYIPIIDGWVALFFAMIIHEGAHGVVARSLGFPVKSSGLFFFLFVPLGAFVEVDDKALKAARARDSGRILAAGAGVNFIAGIVFLLLMFSLVSTMAPAADGLAIQQVSTPSPASTVGLRPGDFIVAVNGAHLDSPAQIQDASWYRPGQSINLTVYRQGTTLQLNGLVVGSRQDNASLPFIGISSLGFTDLEGKVSNYAGAFLTRPVTYFCIPSFPNCQGVVPFSDQLSIFYTSSYGQWLVPLANFFYWMFFLNFNLAIFNALPIYPLDGGQAFEAGLKGLTKSSLSEKSMQRILTGVTLAIIVVIASLPLAAYLNLI